jgi:hypothetical protein
MGLTFAQPLAALAALAGIVPVAVALLRIRGGRRARRALDLPEPNLAALLARPAALACLFGLLGLAAARPALRLQHERTVRTDVQVVVALDSSRSMLAASAPGGPERWQRAAAFALRLQAELPGVPIGLSSLTNRLLPYLFPTSDARAYDLVLAEAYGIQKPPPALTIDRWVTTFDSLNEGTVRRFFSPNVHRRVLVVLSDAETRSFEAHTVLRQLEQAGTTPVVVRFWSAGERIFQPGSESYRATQPGVLNTLRAAGWPAYSETQLGAAVRRIRAAVGSGPSIRVGYAEEEVQLAGWLALAAFLPLLLLLSQGGWLRLRRGRVPRPGRGIAVSRVATRPDSHAH